MTPPRPPTLRELVLAGAESDLSQWELEVVLGTLRATVLRELGDRDLVQVLEADAPRGRVAVRAFLMRLASRDPRAFAELLAAVGGAEGT